jgi:hypothetical protein
MLKRAHLLAMACLLVATPIAAEPLFEIGEARGRLAEACANLLRDQSLQEAFAALGAAAGAAEKARWDDLPVQPLSEAVRAKAATIAEPDLLLLVDLHHCRQTVRSTGGVSKACLGSTNLLNTGLPNYHPEDTERDLLHWHKLSAFAGSTIAYPKRRLDPDTPGTSTQLQCRAVQP